MREPLASSRKLRRWRAQLRRRQAKVERMAKEWMSTARRLTEEEVEARRLPEDHQLLVAVLRVRELVSAEEHSVTRRKILASVIFVKRCGRSE